MPEANEQLEEVMPEYPLCFALTGLGVAIVLAIEQITLAIGAKTREGHSHHHDHNHGHGHEHKHSQYFTTVVSGMLDGETLAELEEPLTSKEECSFAKCPHNTSNYHATETSGSTIHKRRVSKDIQDHDHGHGHGHGHEHAHDHGHDHDHSCPHHNHEHAVKRTASSTHFEEEHNHEAVALDDVLKAESMRDLITAYALEVSTAIHSIVIGVDLGMLDDYNTIAILLAALCFHQFVEGLGLGTVIAGSSGQLGNSKVISFVVVFSSMVSFGVTVGILTSAGGESEFQSTAKGVATSIAAGSLLYTSLTEMAGSSFNRKDLEDRLGLKTVMVLAFVAGIVIMGIIGIWA